jgi:hypothetical protein
MHGRFGTTLAAACAIAVLGTGCTAGVAARWEGTGERFEARYYQLVLDLGAKVPSAAWLDAKGAQTRLAVCGFAEKEGQVSFRLDPDTPGLTCDELRKPLLFQGTFGRDVLAGTVVDGQGRAVGRFRAFRAAQ